MRLLLAGCATLLLSATAVAADQTFTPRLQTPRVAPLDKEQRTPAQQAMLASRPDFNIYKTLAHHVDLYNRWSPLGQFVLNGSSLPPREREIVMLRMGWLCQSEYEWAQHARIAQSAGGPDQRRHSSHRRGSRSRGLVGLRAHAAANGRRAALRHDDQRRDLDRRCARSTRCSRSMEALYTAAQYQLVSMALNSLGVQLDPGLEDRLPKDVRLPALATRPKSPRLKQPRVPPLSESQWSDEQRKLVAAQTDRRGRC